ncbi:type II secretion system F family protein [Candidatus Uhrbacteria bacterium]|nr:type II secretion system F family protein [Candidatus Uhrbacteria bacterium]
MPTFIYHALDPDGSGKQGEIQASDRKAAMAALAKDGLTVISLREKKAGGSRVFQTGRVFGRVTALDRILLTSHLASIITAGVSLSEAIDILIYNNQKRPALRKVLEEARRSLEEGRPLSSAFEAHPEHFSPLFVGLLKVGEASGTLEETLQSLEGQLFRDYELTRKVRAATMYPAVLLAASGGIIVLLLTFVLPRLAASFGDSNLRLPFVTRVLVDASNALAANKLLSIGAFVLAAAAALWFFGNPTGKRYLARMLSRLPISKELVRQLALARFARTLKNLIKSGVPLVQGFDIVAVSVGNEDYRAEISDMREELRKGLSLAEGFRKREHYFPRLVTSLVSVGEKTGTLEKSLDTISVFYEKEAERTLNSLVTLLEPLLLLIMGFVVGTIAISVLLPIYQMISQVR